MFTGIIEATAKLISKQIDGENIHFVFSCPFTNELKIDQSLSHNGICLTVVEIKNNQYKVTAIKETLDRSNLSSLKIDDEVNLERCMLANGRFDGHIVQGHIDQTATCEKIEEQNGSWKFYFRYDPSQGNLTVEKGSVCINGVSLTVVDSASDSFSVCVIPYTFHHTNFNSIQPTNLVNVEFDVLGKYIKRIMSSAQ